MNTVAIKFCAKPALSVFLFLALSACTEGLRTDQTSEGSAVLPKTTPVSSTAGPVNKRRTKSGEIQPLFPSAEKSDQSLFSSDVQAALNPPPPPSADSLPSLKEAVTAPPSAVLTSVSAEGGAGGALPSPDTAGADKSVTLSVFPKVTAPPLIFKDVFYSPLWQKTGGSNIYRGYMAESLVYLNERFKEMPGEARSQWSFLCEDDFCSSGIKNVNDLSERDLILAIHRLGLSDETYYINETQALILHGNFRKPEEIKTFLKKLDEQIVSEGKLKRVLVNMSHEWVEPDLMFELGFIIKRSGADLHIIGQCSGMCAYLIPAAKKVIVEPYGYIAYNGGHAEIYREITRIMDSNTAKLKEQFHQAYFSQGVREGLKDMFNDADFRFVNNLLGIPVTLNAFNQFLSRHLKGSLEELSEDERNNFVNGFVNGLSEETLSKMTAQVFEISDHHKAVIRTKKFASRQKELAEREQLYYKELNIPAKGEEGYSYPELVDLSTRMIRLDLYDSLFVVNRMSFDVPESEKPYIAVLPSAKILRQAGIDIYGENNGEALQSLYNGIEGAILLLDTEDIENCRLFSSSSYIMEDIQNCMAQNDRRLEVGENGENGEETLLPQLAKASEQ